MFFFPPSERTSSLRGPPWSARRLSSRPAPRALGPLFAPGARASPRARLSGLSSRPEPERQDPAAVSAQPLCSHRASASGTTLSLDGTKRRGSAPLEGTVSAFQLSSSSALAAPPRLLTHGVRHSQRQSPVGFYTGVHMPMTPGCCTQQCTQPMPSLAFRIRGRGYRGAPVWFCSSGACPEYNTYQRRA